MNNSDYTTRDLVDDDLNEIGRQISHAFPIGLTGLMIRTLILLTHAVADVADAIRNHE